MFCLNYDLCHNSCVKFSFSVTFPPTGAQQLSSLLKSHYNTTSLTLVIQDGVDAGQTVKHVHIHLMPRLPGDFANNDDIYGEIERVDSRKSEVRTEVEMEREAQTYRELAKEMGISSS